MINISLKIHERTCVCSKAHWVLFNTFLDRFNVLLGDSNQINAIKSFYSLFGENGKCQINITPLKIKKRKTLKNNKRKWEKFWSKRRKEKNFPEAKQSLSSPFYFTFIIPLKKRIKIANQSLFNLLPKKIQKKEKNHKNYISIYVADIIIFSSFISCFFSAYWGFFVFQLLIFQLNTFQNRFSLFSLYRFFCLFCGSDRWEQFKNTD